MKHPVEVNEMTNHMTVVVALGHLVGGCLQVFGPLFSSTLRRSFSTQSDFLLASSHSLVASTHGACSSYQSHRAFFHKASIPASTRLASFSFSAIKRHLLEFQFLVPALSFSSLSTPGFLFSQ